jgi:hypothetical protein
VGKILMVFDLRNCIFFNWLICYDKEKEKIRFPEGAQ